MVEPVGLRTFGPAAVAEALTYPRLIMALRRAFSEPVSAMPRQVSTVDPTRGSLLLTMPAWRREAGAVKIVTYLPDNPARHGQPTVQGVVVLFDGDTGAPLAVADGSEITLRRTAAASALAADYLAAPDADSLFMIGTGALAPCLVQAHATVRPLRRVELWGRSIEKARALASALSAAHPDLSIEAVADPAASAARCAIVSCATGAARPVLKGAWLGAGAHVDLVGSFSPTMREADDDVVRGARIVVDSREGALSEAGDLIAPLHSGVIDASNIVGDLADLCSGRIAGRTSASQTTVFKSVGVALEDLVAAQLLME